MINFRELRLLVREYFYYNGVFPLLKDIYKTYKAKFDYKNSLRNFTKTLYSLQEQGYRIGFLEEEKEYTYKRKDRPNPVTYKRKIKRLIVK